MTLQHYETTFILTSVLSEQQTKDIIDKFRDFLNQKKAKIIREESWGLKKLAYPIQHKSTGFYQFFEFEGTPDLINELELLYKREEKIIRFLTVKLDKHGIEYNQQKNSAVKEIKTKEAKVA